MMQGTDLTAMSIMVQQVLENQNPHPKKKKTYG